MSNLAKRNLKIFFRDKGAVFFSLLSVLIIIGLYALFLGDSMTSGNENVPGIEPLMGSWVVAGILAVVSMTSTLGAFGTLVDDRAKKIEKDFAVSPLKRGSIAGGYILSAIAVGVIMSLAALVVGEIYIVACGGELLSIQNLLLTLGGILLSVLSSSSIMLLLVSFFRSQSAYSAASILIGTLIGFLTGMYIPIGSLPAAVQTVVKCFPVSYSASYFRTVMMQQPMEVSFANAPQSAVSEFKTELGVTFDWNGQQTTLTVCVIVMAVTAAIFFSLAMLSLSRKRKK
ncbi:MAG: ABC transporter permease [Christensenella sp.]|nr:ABC transporter permease [Christensenella sp.]